MTGHVSSAMSVSPRIKAKCLMAVGVLLCMASSLVIFQAKSFPEKIIVADVGAAAFPAFYSWLLIGLASLLIMQQAQVICRDKTVSTQPIIWSTYVSPLLTVTACIGYIFLMDYFGYAAATLLFLMGVFKLSGVSGWKLIILYSVLFSVLLYAGFSLGLNVPLPESSLFETFFGD